MSNDRPVGNRTGDFIFVLPIFTSESFFYSLHLDDLQLMLTKSLFDLKILCNENDFM